MRRIASAALAPLFLSGCIAADRTAAGGPEPGTVSHVDSPARPGSGEPFLATTASGLLLSWIEATSDSTHALRYARLSGEGWSEPRTVAAGAHWFVNWADFPSILELPDGSLAAHYLQRSGPGKYAYDVWVTRSADGGATWSAPERPHHDGTETEHGFVTLFPVGNELGAVWLDGRAYAGEQTSHENHGSEMSLRFTTFSAAGAAPEIALDERTCDCCQTAVAHTGSGPVVFYRDRSPDEIRDIFATRLVNGAWSQPAAVHADGWRIDACPVNGPAAAARGSEVVVAWFTAAQDTPRVQVAFSGDAGASFSVPVRVDGGDPAGRVGVVLTDGAAYVSWLENAGDGAEIRVRRVARDGSLGAPAVVSGTSSARASGFPRIALHGDALWFAWTEPGDSARVRTARMQLTDAER